ncbi:MAG: AhpC/TSA family protein [Nannocystaceae bacterium]|nr:AhpC/TSA family protein [Nannocystaceae bacterium]
MAVIGNGSPVMAQDFAEQFKVGVPLYTDPSRKSYELAGWRRPMGSAVLGMGTMLKAGVRAMKGGFRQGKTKGDAFQIGGVLVVEPGGAVRFEHADKTAGDHAAIADILASLSAA